MKKLYEYLAKNRINADVGVEIECEGANLHADPLPGMWKVIRDGSLRGAFPHEACEYVMSQPLTKAAARSAIYRLAEANKAVGAKFNFSHRTSVHVHVNVLELTFNQICAFIYTSLLVENVLSRYCGEQRVNNHFALRVCDAEGYIRTMRRVFAEGNLRGMAYLREDHIKYSFINPFPICKYGSVEFRGMRGTMDTKVLSNWLTALLNIRAYASNTGNPQAVHDDFVRSAPRDFFIKVFGEDVAPEFDYEELTSDLRSAFSLTMELPYSFRSEVGVNGVIGVPRGKNQFEVDIWPVNGAGLGGIDPVPDFIQENVNRIPPIIPPVMAALNPAPKRKIPQQPIDR